MELFYKLTKDQYRADFLVDKNSRPPRFMLRIKEYDDPIIAPIELRSNFWSKVGERLKIHEALNKYKISTTTDKDKLFNDIYDAYRTFKSKQELPKSRDELLKLLDEGVKLKQVHPAIDFVGDRGYFGIKIKIEKDMKLEDIYCMIGSDGDIFEINPASLKDRNLSPITDGALMINSWSHDGVKEYLEGKRPDPIQLIADISTEYEKYIDFPDERYYYLLSLWTLGTYMFPLFDVYPYMFLHGFKECGKSKVLKLTSLMAFNSIFSGNMSTSQLYRLIKSGRVSFFIDETENLNNPDKAAEMRNLLLNGYKAGGKVYRTGAKEDKFKTEEFEIYSPKMMANINGMEDVLESRCITIVMLKAKYGDPRGNSEPNNKDKTWQNIKDRCYSFALDNFSRIREIYDSLENTTEVSNRDWELWKPLMALTQFLGEYGHERYYTKNQEINKNSEVNSAKLGVSEDNLQNSVNSEGESSVEVHQMKNSGNFQMCDFLLHKFVNDGDLKGSEASIPKSIFFLTKKNTTLLLPPGEHNLHFYTKNQFLGVENLTEMANEVARKKKSKDALGEAEYRVMIQLYRNICDKGDGQWLPLKEIASGLKEELKEGEDDAGPKWVTSRWISKLLNKYRFDDKRRVGQGIEIYIDKEKIKDVYERYIPDSIKDDMSQENDSNEESTQKDNKVSENGLNSSSKEVEIVDMTDL